MPGFMRHYEACLLRSPQLYDGVVQHKLMGLHQIRYDVDLLPYDLTWNVIAAALLAAGIVLWVVTARRDARAGTR